MATWATDINRDLDHTKTTESNMALCSSTECRNQYDLRWLHRSLTSASSPEAAKSKVSVSTAMYIHIYKPWSSPFLEAGAWNTDTKMAIGGIVDYSGPLRQSSPESPL